MLILFNQCVGIELSIEKHVKPIMKRVKRKTVEEIELLIPESIRTLEGNWYKFLGTLEALTIKQAEIKKKKMKKNITENGENLSKPNFAAEVSLKE